MITAVSGVPSASFGHNLGKPGHLERHEEPSPLLPGCFTGPAGWSESSEIIPECDLVLDIMVEGGHQEPRPASQARPRPLTLDCPSTPLLPVHHTPELTLWSLPGHLSPPGWGAHS